MLFFFFYYQNISITFLKINALNENGDLPTGFSDLDQDWARKGVDEFPITAVLTAAQMHY